MCQVNAGKRVYASPARDRQARLTRREILDAAAELFVAQGYGRTSVAEVAARAGVTAQTVYNAVGPKPDLLKAAYDAVLVGDDEPIPLADRPQVRAMSTLRDPAELLRAYAALSREVVERVGPLMLQIAAGAAGGDSDLIEHQRVTDAERLTGTTRVIERVVELEALAAGLSPDRARDRIWTLNSVQVWQLLTGARGWSGPEYETWLGDAMIAAVLGSQRSSRYVG
jgi:AcrR family transcriptional regulator